LGKFRDISVAIACRLLAHELSWEIFRDIVAPFAETDLSAEIYETYCKSWKDEKS
jgi:hypothetical protein